MLMKSFFFIMTVFGHDGVDHSAETPAASPAVIAPPAVKSPTTPAAVVSPTVEKDTTFSSAGQNFVNLVGVSSIMSIF